MTDLRLLWASPLPPIRSGVADYAAEILPELASRAHVEIVPPPGWQPPREPWTRGLRFVEPERQTGQGQVALLHLGNNPYHIWIARRVREGGCVVVLHDAVLHHLLVEEAAAEGAWDRFAAEVEAAHPGHGAALARARRWGYVGRLEPFLFPARRALLSRAGAVIVHSEWVARRVAAELPGVPVGRVPLAVAKLAGGQREAMRARLGAAADELVVTHLGYLTPAKGLATVLQGIAALRELGVAARLVVVGEESGADPLDRHVRALGLERQVVRWGWASRGELAGILAATDLGVVPRYPTAGETSAAALRFLAAGRPVVVSGYAQFLEFPVAAAPRIAVGAAGVADFVRHALALRGGGWRAACAAARRAWQEGGHEPARAAERLLVAVQELCRELA